MKSVEQSEQLLLDHRLRITGGRVAILQQFLQARHALSHADIEHLLRNFDRVTIYRTLSSFMEKGLIHKVPDETGVAKYALCHDKCTEHSHDDGHIHFYCTRCRKTYCLDHQPVPRIKLPDDYVLQEFNLLVNGICKNCNKKKHG